MTALWATRAAAAHSLHDRSSVGTPTPSNSNGGATASSRGCCAMWAVRLFAVAASMWPAATSRARTPAARASRWRPLRSRTGMDEDHIASLEQDQHQVHPTDEQRGQPDEHRP